MATDDAPLRGPSPLDPGLRRGAGPWRTILLGWALAAIVLLAASATAIAQLRFPDPDDAMRMLEVRDWIAGQPWFDVAQHRLNHGDFPMHWSRLVDVPLATIMMPLDPLLGATASTRVAMAIVPLATLLAVMALVALLTRRLAGRATARLAVLLVPLSVPIVAQVRPLRIDHHGWQVVLALAAVLPLTARPTRRGGMAAGLALAALLTVSLEGLPIAASIVAVAALDWVVRIERATFLRAMTWTLFGAAALLQLATRGPAAMAPACDAMAPAWIAILGIAAAGITIGTMIERYGAIARVTMLGITGAAAATTLVTVAPACLSGPFATLPPHVYRWWYLLVAEGRPLWEQTPSWAAITVGLPLAGMVGAVRAWRATDGRTRRRWTILLALQVAATVVAVFVNRAGATANALAVPGAATLLAALLTRARAIRPAGRRTLATAGALLLASPGQVAAMAFAFGAPLALRQAAEPPPTPHRAACDHVADLRGIGRLPPATLFAPIDATPDLIATTHHRAIAAGYHRDAAAMDVVMTGFTARPARARAAILASGADYVLVCPGLNEPDLYRAVAPDGLWSRLERGERFGWLAPVALPGPMLAWRVIRPLPRSAPHP